MIKDNRVFDFKCVTYFDGNTALNIFMDEIIAFVNEEYKGDSEKIKWVIDLYHEYFIDYAYSEELDGFDPDKFADYLKEFAFKTWSYMKPYTVAELEERMYKEPDERWWSIDTYVDRHDGFTAKIDGKLRYLICENLPYLYDTED